MAGGLAVAAAYGLFFTHAEAVYLLGATACIAYVFDKIRVAYPEIARQVQGVANLFLRAEEKLAESSMVPYVIAVLLTIISFPKPISLMAISTLALADPVAAVVGIKFGRRHLVPDKTVEGSLAFFAASFLCASFVMFRVVGAPWPAALGISLLVSLAVTVFETLPVKLDDNLTIPLFVGFTGWLLCAIFGVALP